MFKVTILAQGSVFFDTLEEAMALFDATPSFCIVSTGLYADHVVLAEKYGA